MSTSCIGGGGWGETHASAEGQHPQGHKDLMNEVSFIE